LKVKIKDLVIDTSIDIRDRLDEDTIATYAENLDNLPPVVVFRTDEGLLLSDGFHRATAAERIGRSEVEAEVKRGTRDDALEYAAIANMRHGRRLSVNEQREAIRRIRRLHPKWGREQIANLLGVGTRFVQGTLSADEVKKVTMASDNGLGDGHYQEIAAAPQAVWDDLVKTATKERWTTNETRNAVQTVRDPNIPSDYKRKVVRGQAAPLGRSERGDPSILAETIERRVAQAKAADNEIALWSLLGEISRVRLRWSPDVLVKGLNRKKLENLDQELPIAVRYLQDIIREVSKARKLQPVR
jgi:ParB-like chromosome segregation protein Spo0J